MNELLLAIRQFFRGFRVWIVVSPWEQALRVRLGKSVTLLNPGVHWKLPFADVIYLQSIRLRLAAINKQTLSTGSGEIVTLAGSLGYRIDDIQRLYNSIHHAEDTLASFTRARIAAHVSTHSISECQPERIQAAVTSGLNFTDYGIGGAELYITEFAVVRTYRLIGDYNEYSWGKRLATDVPCTSSSDGT